MEELQELLEISNFLIRETDTTFLRYLHEKVDWSDRLIGIKGPRGIGTTTLLLQHIKLKDASNSSTYGANGK